MSDFPVPVATFVGPPDMQRLLEAQHVSDRTRNDLANHLDSEIMQRKAVLDNAQSELSNHIVLIEANGKVAQQNAIQSLDRRINLTLGNAIGVANEYGIGPPAPSEIRTRTAYPPPAILSAGEGKTPVPPVDSGQPYSGWSAGGKSPAESGAKVFAPSGTPSGVTPGSEMLPGGYVMSKPEPFFPEPSPQGQTIYNVPIVPFETPPQQIQNIPECPPQELCPPAPPCPPPPADPCQFAIWQHPCLGTGGIACYILPFGIPPLDTSDKYQGSINDPMGKSLCDAWSFCEKSSLDLKPCQPGQPPPPPLGPCPPGLAPAPGLCPGLPPVCQPPNAPAPPPCPPGFGLQPGPQGGMICVPLPAQTPPPPQCPPGQVPVWVGNEWVCMTYSQPPVPTPTPTQPSPGQPTSVTSGPITIIAPSVTVGGGQQQQAGPGPVDIPAGDVADPSKTICAGWDAFAAQYKGQNPLQILATAGILTNDFKHLAPCAKLAKDLGGGIWGDIAKFACDIVVMPINALIRIWSKALYSAADVACPDPAPLVAIGTMKASITWMRRLIGIDTRQADTQLNKAENYLCPVETPAIHNANLARLRKNITLDDWRCWIRMAGMHEDYGSKIYASETTWVPPVTDVLHFIVRSLADPQIVKRFGLLDEFDTLYQGQLVDWGEKQGISKATMEFYHAGHWVVPAPAQIFEMLRRLRPDNIPPGVDPNKWTITNDDVDRALRESAYPPFWRERLKQISYTPIGLRQIRKAYPEGGMDATEVEQGLRDIGYSQVDARRFRLILDIERRDFLRKHDVTKLYMQSAINRQTAYDRLIAEHYTDQEANDTLAWAMRETDDKSLTKCLEGIKRRFECGEFDNGDLQSELSDLHLDPEQITRLQTLWECERKTCGKQVSASQLCSWADSGLISSQEYYQRLRNVGYNDIDARSIVIECNIKQETKVLAQRERQARQALAAAQKAADKKQSADRRAVAEARRAVRELRQLQRQAASDVAKAQRQSVNATEKANRIRAAMFRQASSTAGKIRVREAMLAKAAETWAGLRSIDLSTAAFQVQSTLESLNSMGGMSASRSVEAVILAVVGAKKAGTVDLTQAAVDLAHAMRGYAAVATASVCEQTKEGCESPQSNGNTGALVSTSKPLDRSGEPSSDNR